MENNLYLLNKDYWYEIEKAYPVLFSILKDWLADYKMRIGWNGIFTCGIDFFDLPSDMQHGILSRYFFEVGGIPEQHVMAAGKWVVMTRNMFNQLEKRLRELEGYDKYI